ncbi:unnamed protein product [Effrenium voratum]|nr:unnamed protein product [Effrenium voratum]CAJ1416914.1 unnamed protein product [Effrenium voratum]
MEHAKRIKVDLPPIMEEHKLQPDPGCAYKSRGYASFVFEAGELRKRPQRPYETPARSTKAGRAGKRVDLGPLPEGFVSSSEFLAMLAQVLTGVQDMEQGQADKAELGVHLIRTCCKGGAVQISPGFHQDGFQYVALIVLERSNAAGAENCLAVDKCAEPFMTRKLEPGEGLIFNDQKLWHHVTDLTIADPSKGPGFRSMLIVTVDLEWRTASVPVSMKLTF